ncbi:MAG: ABC transporter substrate-binding protein [Alphaproteobacteria bacterium]|nr:ABC transporter substrate-binding protein [Alphaproteobacteria bacterium]
MKAQMDRRNFIALLGGTGLGWSCAVRAQPSTRVYRIGVLNGAAALAANNPLLDALIRALAAHNYVHGRNLAFESRGSDGQPSRLPRLVAEILASKVDLIITFGYPPALAAKNGAPIPVIAINSGDPVATGLVESLARPGGNVTGISDVSAELTPKRMELLKEMVPALRRVAMLWNAADDGMSARYRASETGAKMLGIGVQPLGVREPADFEQAFAAMARERPDAIFMVADPLTTGNRKRVFDYAEANRLPAIYEFDHYVHAGGLMSYAPDPEEVFGRVAALADRIFRGAKPADLPFEQPTRFRLVINLRAAKALGLEVPTSILLRADEVVE